MLFAPMTVNCTALFYRCLSRSCAVQDLTSNCKAMTWTCNCMLLHSHGALFLYDPQATPESQASWAAVKQLMGRACSLAFAASIHHQQQQTQQVVPPQSVQLTSMRLLQQTVLLITADCVPTVQQAIMNGNKLSAGPQATGGAAAAAAGGGDGPLLQQSPIASDLMQEADRLVRGATEVLRLPGVLQVPTVLLIGMVRVLTWLALQRPALAGGKVLAVVLPLASQVSELS
jgi:hypothetical protein